MSKTLSCISNIKGLKEERIKNINQTLSKEEIKQRWHLRIKMTSSRMHIEGEFQNCGEKRKTFNA